MIAQPQLITDRDGQLRAPRLLVVEDNDFSLELAVRWLKRLGYEHVEGARDGVEGLERYCVGSHDILWIDYSLPELDGVSMVQRMHVDAPDNKPWIVLFTAADTGRIEHWMGLGLFDDLLRKPCETRAYMGCMERALAGLRARRAEAAGR